MKDTPYNAQRLAETVTTINPLAIITAIDQSSVTGKTKIQSHLNEAMDLKKTMLCCCAMVEICHKNINPKWGLFNGAIGKVIEISYAEDKNPNSGDMPKHVVVEFEHYCGPVWDKTTPKNVPIEHCKQLCKNFCCT